MDLNYRYSILEENINNNKELLKVNDNFDDIILFARRYMTIDSMDLDSLFRIEDELISLKYKNRIKNFFYVDSEDIKIFYILSEDLDRLSLVEKVNYRKIDNGKKLVFYDNGNKNIEGNYKDGKLEGKLTQWYEDGEKKADFFYKNGKLDGNQIYFYKNGNINWESLYKDGIKNGRNIVFYENKNKKSEFFYIDGKLEKDFINFYENGNKKSKSSYKKNILNGTTTTWYENGNKEAEFFYIDGVREGKVIKWYENGNKSFETYFIHDKVDGNRLTQWNEDGVKISKDKNNSQFISLENAKQKINFKILEDKRLESSLKRGKKRKQAFIVLSFSIILSVISFFIIVNSVKDGFWAIFLPPIIFFIGFFKFWQLLNKTKELNSKFRDFFISEVISKIIPNASYKLKDINLIDSFSISNMFDYYSMMLIENHGTFNYIVDGNKVRMGAIFGKHISNGSKPSTQASTPKSLTHSIFFAGTFASIELKEKIPSFTISNNKIKYSDMKKIMLENSNFDSFFKLWSNDSEGVKKIISNDFINYLMELNKTFDQIAISTDGNRLLIGINIYTHINFKNQSSEEYFDLFYPHFKKVYEIFEKIIFFTIKY